VFRRVLIANRGEIAVRIIRTLRRMGVTSVAVYTDADRLAPHVAMADQAVPLGPDTRAYLDGARLVWVARHTGADAVHPGYGFLSENAAFARAGAAAGITFIGPPPEAIEAMGDKINAKRTVAASGVPVVPGRDEPGLDDRQLHDAALAVGLPVLLKPSAGGGGKGMRLVSEPAELAPAIESARREARGAFGDDTLLVERYVPRPRHIEMQVFADTHGNCVALGERECSLQRRHQKIVEEAPSPLLDPATRAAMGASAVAAAVACGYVGAGTVEFIVSADRPDEYFFMEMNTRLQVEHPVTEMTLGVDLVEWQLRVAAGARLPWTTTDEVPAPSGHAVEARVYAEDPDRGFLPSSGPLLAWQEPTGRDGVRVDSGVRQGMPIGTGYDPMLAKVIAWGEDRGAALARLDGALTETVALGVTTNIGFLRRLVADPDVAAGDLDTGLVERIADRTGPAAVPDAVWVAAALLPEAGPAQARSGPDPWRMGDGWRVSGPAARVTRWRSGTDRAEVSLHGGSAARDGRDLGPVRSWTSAARLMVEVGGRLVAFTWAEEPAGAGGEDAVWLGCDGSAWRLVPERTVLMHRGRAGPGAGRVNSPMPGTVLSVHVEAGQSVETGDRLVVVEAMKMEHTIRAAEAGTVTEVLVGTGDPVRLDQPLVTIEATP
jgi:acetyl-CoA/propionyl-CoA carboxylase biotin carboxyl carrier protein